MQNVTFTAAEYLYTDYFANNLKKRLVKAYKANAKAIAEVSPGNAVPLLTLPAHFRWFKPWEWALCPKGRLCPETFRRTLIRSFVGIVLFPVRHPVSGEVRFYMVLYRKPVPWADAPSPTPAAPAQLEDAEASPPPG